MAGKDEGRVWADGVQRDADCRDVPPGVRIQSVSWRGSDKQRMARRGERGRGQEQGQECDIFVEILSFQALIENIALN